MARDLVIAVITAGVLLAANAVCEAANRSTVTLLPVAQNAVTERSRIADQAISAALLAEFTRIDEFDLVPFIELHQACEEQLIDDAISELLAADRLDRTLMRLDAFDTAAGRRALYQEQALKMGVDYLVEMTLTEDRYRIEVNYMVASTRAKRVVRARSFFEVRGDPHGLCHETAKRLTRSLWKARHREIDAAQP